VFGTAVLALALTTACSVKVDKNGNGSDKDVDIKTPVGDLSVHKNGAPQDTGIELYAGARPIQENDDDTARVSLNLPGFGMKVATSTFESDDAPEKVLAFYRGSMKQHFGHYVECRGSMNVNVSKDGDHTDFSSPVSCKNEGNGSTIELKTGTEGNQHDVGVTPKGKGSMIRLIYVRLRTKNDPV
jgi:hypothetical protein